jgi:hypothetical protein
MATYRGEVVTRWRSEAGRNDMELATLYAGAFTDVTGQPDKNIPTDPNALVVYFEMDEAEFTRLQAVIAAAKPTEAVPIILWSEEVKAEVP